MLLLSAAHSVEEFTWQSYLDNPSSHLENGIVSQKNRGTENSTCLNFLYSVHKLGWGIAYRFGEEKITVGVQSVIYMVLSEKERVGQWTLPPG